MSESGGFGPFAIPSVGSTKCGASKMVRFSKVHVMVDFVWVLLVSVPNLDE